MASNHSNSNSSAADGERSKEPTQTHTQVPSPRTFRRAWSTTSTSPACGQGGAPKCVCAPATHAGSFKCRLHRTNSHTHVARTPRGPSSAVSGSSTRTVEAQ